MAFRKAVTYEEMEGKIPESVREPLLDLEAAGFSVLVGAKIEDAYQKDGTRRQTFRAAGKYDLVIAARNVGDLVDVETRISALAEENEQLGRINRNLKDKLGRRDKQIGRLTSQLQEHAAELERIHTAEAQAEADAAEVAEAEAIAAEVAEAMETAADKAVDESAKE